MAGDVAEYLGGRPEREHNVVGAGRAVRVGQQVLVSGLGPRPVIQRTAASPSTPVRNSQSTSRLSGCGGPAAAQALRRYTAALLTQIHTRHRGEEGFLWPLLAAIAGPAVDLTPLADDRQAIDAAAGRARLALARPLAGLWLPVHSLSGLLDAHLTDTEQQVFPALRRYLPAGATAGPNGEFGRTRVPPTAASPPRGLPSSAGGRTAPASRPRGWRARIPLAATRPGHARLERQALGPGRTETQHHEEEK